jgi:hypothetical protein
MPRRMLSVVKAQEFGAHIRCPVLKITLSNVKMIIYCTNGTHKERKTVLTYVSSAKENVSTDKFEQRTFISECQQRITEK